MYNMNKCLNAAGRVGTGIYLYHENIAPNSTAYTSDRSKRNLVIRLEISNISSRIIFDCFWVLNVGQQKTILNLC